MGHEARPLSDSWRPGKFLLVFVLLTATTSMARAALPAGWVEVDVGGSGGPQSASESGGTWTIGGAGSDIWTPHDRFHYVYCQIGGDVTITAHVASLENTQEWAKAGVMFRQTISADDGANGGHCPFVMACGTVGQGTGLEWRDTAGEDGQTVWGGSAGANAPTWVRVERKGNVFTADCSTDGKAWTALPGSPHTTVMSDPCYVGFAVCSHIEHVLATATFDQVTVTAHGGTVGGGTDWIEPGGSLKIDRPSEGLTLKALAQAAKRLDQAAKLKTVLDELHKKYDGTGKDEEAELRQIETRVDEWAKGVSALAGSLEAKSPHDAETVYKQLVVRCEGLPAGTASKERLGNPAFKDGLKAWPLVEKLHLAERALVNVAGASPSAKDVKYAAQNKPVLDVMRQLAKTLQGQYAHTCVIPQANAILARHGLETIVELSVPPPRP